MNETRENRNGRVMLPVLPIAEEIYHSAIGGGYKVFR